MIVQGTRKLLQLSKKYQIKQFIFISSDKAFYPQGVMGKSKLQAENVILKHRSYSKKNTSIS